MERWQGKKRMEPLPSEIIRMPRFAGDVAVTIRPYSGRTYSEPVQDVRDNRDPEQVAEAMHEHVTRVRKLHPELPLSECLNISPQELARELQAKANGDLPTPRTDFKI